MMPLSIRVLNWSVLLGLLVLSFFFLGESWRWGLTTLWNFLTLVNIISYTLAMVVGVLFLGFLAWVVEVTEERAMRKGDQRIAAEERGMVKDPLSGRYITIEEMDRQYDEICAVYEYEWAGLLSVEERNRRFEEIHARHMAEAARRQERNRLDRIEQQLRELQRQRGD